MTTGREILRFDPQNVDELYATHLMIIDWFRDEVSPNFDKAGQELIAKYTTMQIENLNQIVAYFYAVVAALDGMTERRDQAKLALAHAREDIEREDRRNIEWTIECTPEQAEIIQQGIRGNLEGHSMLLRNIYSLLYQFSEEVLEDRAEQALEETA